jgi:hypothetical protein
LGASSPLHHEDEPNDVTALTLTIKRARFLGLVVH